MTLIGCVVAAECGSGPGEHVGISAPTTEDITTTQQLKEACRVVGVELLDHVILGSNGRHWSWANDERPGRLLKTGDRSAGTIAARDRGRGR